MKFLKGLVLLCGLVSAVQAQTLHINRESLPQAKQYVLDRILQSSYSQLIAFGKVYQSSSLDVFVQDLIKELASQTPDFNCYFLNESSSYQEAFNLLMSGNTLAAEEKYLEKFEFFHDIFKREFCFEILSQVNMQEVKKLQDLGLQVLAVDEGLTEPRIVGMGKAFKEYMSHRSSLDFYTAYVDVFLRQRNLSMAKNIENYYSNKKCSRGIFSVGNDHLFANISDVPNLYNLLKEKLNIFSVSIKECNGLRDVRNKICRPEPQADITILIRD